MAIEEFTPKLFSAAHKHIIKQSNAIIDEYGALGYKLTLRQIFYQHVARDWMENTQQNYKKLGNVLNAARLAGRVDWDAIEDVTRGLRRVAVYAGPEAAVRQVRNLFKLDPWDHQPKKRRVEVWVEKDAAVSIVKPTCDKLRIAYFSCRGYSSSTGLYDAGKRLMAYRDAGYETLVLYLGDHDPSGVQMTDSTIEKVNMFAGGGIEIRRIALTLEQIEKYDPPANFVKETDSRTKWYVEQFNTEDCWELDALKPQVVDELIRSHVEPLIDQEAWDKTMAREADEMKTLDEIISDWRRTKAAPDMLRVLLDHATNYDVEAQPISDDGEYDNADSATLEMFIDESQDVLRRHGLIDGPIDNFTESENTDD